MKEIGNLYGLIGYPLSHSFSEKYFTEKFEREQISDSAYQLFPLESIEELPQLLKDHPQFRGINVTLPYKIAVLKYLDQLDPAAAQIGAVNVIKIDGDQLMGYNSDAYGFEQSLLQFFDQSPQLRPEQALVFGTGGASKAIIYVLQKLNIPFQLVSRSAEKGDLTYKDIDPKVLEDHRLLINTTPLGMSPKIETAPSIDYDLLGKNHFLYDLVYNPLKTLFLENGKQRGAAVCSGLEMLHLQAEKAWTIWQK